MQLFLALNIVLIAKSSFAQLPDTLLQLRLVEITDQKIVAPGGYKAFQFDSLTMGNYASSGLSDLLHENSALNIKSYGLGGLATLSIRGSAAEHTKVFWNGIPINYSVLGQSDFSIMPVFLIDEVDVHYGGSSLIDGSGGLGGSLQLNNFPEWNKKINLQIMGNTGSFNQYMGGAKLGISIGKWYSRTKIFYQQAQNDFSYINIAKKGNPKEVQENADFHQKAIMHEIYHKGKGIFSTRFWLQEVKRNLPKTLLMASNNEMQQDLSFRSLMQYSRLFGKTQCTFRSGFTTDEIQYVNVPASINSVTNMSGWYNQINMKMDLGSNAILSTTLFGDVLQAVSDNFASNVTRKRQALMMKLDLGFTPTLMLNVIARQEWIDSYFRILPSVGYRWRVISYEKVNFYLKGNYTRNFHAPTLKSLYFEPYKNPDLKPEQNWVLEQGILLERAKGKITFTSEATGYYSIVDDWILWSPNEKGIFRPQNLKKVENMGVEVLFRGGLRIKGITIAPEINYAYTKATNLESYNGVDSIINKQLIYIPLNKAQGKIVIGYKDWHVTYNQALVGDRFITNDNFWYMPWFTTGNVSVSKRINLGKYSSMNLQFQIKNIWDENYQVIAWRPMPGRQYLFSLNYNISK